MKSEKITIARIERDREIIREVGAVLRHPAVAIVAAFILVESLQKVYVGPRREPLMGTTVGTMLETALIATPMIQAAGQAVAGVASAISPTKALAAVT